MLFRPIIAEPPKVKKLVLAMCALHNYLRDTQDTTYCPPGYADTVLPNGEVREGFWRTGDSVSPLASVDVTSRSMTVAGVELRDMLSEYFVSGGSVPWQERHIHRR